MLCFGMRAIWKGSITFGLVYIPVAVYPATREEKISFRQLRARDLSPIRYKKVAEADEKEVKPEEIVKGFEYEKGHWVTLQDEDFEKVKIESTHSIEITDFVEQSQINPKFFYKPYFLEAQKGGEKPYALLYKALLESGKIGIAKVVILSREYLAAVKPDGLFLMLELMHFAHEVLEPEALKTPSEKDVSPKELDMAKALIESMTTEWEPAKYKDQVQGRGHGADRTEGPQQTTLSQADCTADGLERGGPGRRSAGKPAKGWNKKNAAEKLRPRPIYKRALEAKKKVSGGLGDCFFLAHTANGLQAIRRVASL